MKINPSRLFPHPVIWFANDDYSSSDFKMSMSYQIEFGNLIIDYCFEVINSELLEQIESRIINYAVHIESPLSMFRKTYVTNSNKGKIEINTKCLADKVDILPLIVAQSDIDNYQNRYLNEDYKGAVLRIPKGSIMGVSDYRNIYIEKEQNELAKKESIFLFIKNPADEPMKIETEEQKLIIKLKEEDFNKLQMLQTTSKYRSVVYSMFIVPALIFAMESIDDDLDIMREKLWFRSLEKACNASNIELNKTTVMQRTSYHLAQLLLQDPISSALLTLTESGGES